LVNEYESKYFKHINIFFKSYRIIAICLTVSDKMESPYSLPNRAPDGCKKRVERE